ncbi:MAG: EamA family transporter [Flavobacteriales bacterium]|nr:MAG: EamA family transporter [Flavobacteriales bacterium]
MKNNILKGVLLVALGATSYGMLATFVKLAYKDGFTTAEITSSQFIYGILGLLLINLFQKIFKKEKTKTATSKNIFQLMIAGTSLGMTSVFYYLCVRYIDVSIAIVLLMQTVWMGVLLEWFLDKKLPSKQKIISVIIVLLGTFLATKLYEFNLKLDWKGVFWGILAAASFTTTMFTANKVAIEISSAQRSLYMLLGGSVMVFIFSAFTQVGALNIDIFKNYGLFLAFFGTIIPPILLNAGFPKTGLGLGSIVASLELPVSVLMAFLILNEKVVFWQWCGILLIIFAVIIMNLNLSKKE